MVARGPLAFPQTIVWWTWAAYARTVETIARLDEICLAKGLRAGPAALIAWRKDKKGFVNPQDDWLKGNLQPVVRDLMGRSDARVHQAGLVDQVGYLDRFDAYCGRGHVWFRDVFAPFALELWMATAADIAQDLKKQMQCHATA